MIRNVEDKRHKDNQTIIDQIKLIDEVLCKNNIPYCACGGTLLGCIRHQGFMPWDDDFDILMEESDLHRCVKNDLFKNIGFEIDNPILAKVSVDDDIDNSLIINKDGIYSDIFPFQIHKRY